MYKINNADELTHLRSNTSGNEFDWLGMNRAGFLAIFSSFHSGYIPECVFNSIDHFNTLVDAIDCLPQVSEGIKITRETGRYDDWKVYAKKGLFAYDNGNARDANNTDTYELIYRPVAPIHMSSIKQSKGFEIVVPIFNLDFEHHLNFAVLKASLLIS